MDLENDRRFRTAAEIARHYGVKPSVVKDWRNRGMPQSSNGFWYLIAIDPWIRLNSNTVGLSGLSSKTGGQENLGQTALAQAVDDATRAKLRSITADADKKEADARIKQLTLQKMEDNDIVDLADVEMFLTQFLADSRKLLLRIPPKMKRFGPRAVEECRRQIDLALHGMGKQAERLADVRED